MLLLTPTRGRAGENRKGQGAFSVPPPPAPCDHTAAACRGCSCSQVSASTQVIARTQPAQTSRLAEQESVLSLSEPRCWQRHLLTATLLPFSSFHCFELSWVTSRDAENSARLIKQNPAKLVGCKPNNERSDPQACAKPNQEALKRPALQCGYQQRVTIRLRGDKGWWLNDDYPLWPPACPPPRPPLVTQLSCCAHQQVPVD